MIKLFLLFIKRRAYDTRKSINDLNCHSPSKIYKNERRFSQCQFGNRMRWENRKATFNTKQKLRVSSWGTNEASVFTINVVNNGSIACFRKGSKSGTRERVVRLRDSNAIYKWSAFIKQHIWNPVSDACWNFSFRKLELSQRMWENLVLKITDRKKIFTQERM